MSYCVIIAADLRRFTKTMQECNNHMVIGPFLSSFYYECKLVLERHDIIIHKFLGDGFLAYSPISDPDNLSKKLDNIINILIEIQSIVFPQIVHVYGFSKLGLSIVLSKGQISKLGNTDEIISNEINYSFKLLDIAKGNLILVFPTLVNYLYNNWILIPEGLLTYHKTRKDYGGSYSILRRKEEDEKELIRTCNDNCRNYFICQRAWQIGKMNKKINCQYCDCKSSNPCWQWKSCLDKYEYGETHQGNFEEFECCHICKHFKECYHSNCLGMYKLPMIWCGYMNPYELMKRPSKWLP